MSISKSLTSFAYCFFHLKKPLCLGLAFDATERNGRFGRIQCERCKESSSRGKSIPLQKDRESSKMQNHPNEPSKNRKLGPFVGERGTIS